MTRQHTTCSRSPPGAFGVTTGRGPPKWASDQALRGADDQIRTGDPNLGKVLAFVRLVLMRPAESAASGSSVALSGSSALSVERFTISDRRASSANLGLDHRYVPQGSAVSTSSR